MCWRRRINCTRCEWTRAPFKNNVNSDTSTLHQSSSLLSSSCLKFKIYFFLVPSWGGCRTEGIEQCLFVCLMFVFVCVVFVCLFWPTSFWHASLRWWKAIQSLLLSWSGRRAFCYAVDPLTFSTTRTCSLTQSWSGSVLQKWVATHCNIHLCTCFNLYPRIIRTFLDEPVCSRLQ